MPAARCETQTRHAEIVQRAAQTVRREGDITAQISVVTAVARLQRGRGTLEEHPWPEQTPRVSSSGLAALSRSLPTMRERAVRVGTLRSRALSALLLIGGVASVCSCAQVHERDAGADDAWAATDAPSSPDASREVYYTLEPAEFIGTGSFDRCGEVAGATAIATLNAHSISTCDTPAPVDVAIDTVTRWVTLTPHFWRVHDGHDCGLVDYAYTRDIRVAGMTPGAWILQMVATRSASTTSAGVIGDAASITCPPPSMGTVPAGGVCRADCECALGLECIAVRGDAACERLCGLSCQSLEGLTLDPSLSCYGAQACVRDPTLGSICETNTMDLCDDTHPCRAGMTCPIGSPRKCEWSITLDAASHHACTTSTDCAVGLDCVQRASGPRTCEVRCTTSIMICPDGTMCDMPDWVCS